MPGQVLKKELSLGDIRGSKEPIDTGREENVILGIRVAEGMSMDHELRILLEGMKDDFKAVAEGVSGLREEMAAFREENRQEHEEFKAEILSLKADVYVLKSDMAEVKADVHVLKSDMVDVKADVAEIRKDLGDHRVNTELHQGKQRA